MQKITIFLLITTLVTLFNNQAIKAADPKHVTTIQRLLRLPEAQARQDLDTILEMAAAKDVRVKVVQPQQSLKTVAEKQEARKQVAQQAVKGLQDNAGFAALTKQLTEAIATKQEAFKAAQSLEEKYDLQEELETTYATLTALLGKMKPALNTTKGHTLGELRKIVQTNTTKHLELGKIIGTNAASIRTIERQSRQKQPIDLLCGIQPS